MNKFAYILLGVIMLLLASASCKNNTYAEKRKAEQKLWQEYKSNNNLEISTDSAYCFNRPCPWPENLYFQTYRGAYVRLIEDDTTQIKAQEGHLVIFRFSTYDLYGNLNSENHDNSINREGFYFVYTPGSEDASISIAFTDAVGCIHHGTKFEVIVDSKLGVKTQQEAVVTTRIVVDETTIRNQ